MSKIFMNEHKNYQKNICKHSISSATTMFFTCVINNAVASAFFSELRLLFIISLENVRAYSTVGILLYFNLYANHFRGSPLMSCRAYNNKYSTTKVVLV